MKKNNLFDVSNKVVIVTGGTGALGSSMAGYLMEEGANIVLLGFSEKKMEAKLDELKQIHSNIIGFSGSVLNKTYLENTKQEVLKTWGKIDILINAAGGNMPGATIGDDETFFDLKMDDFRKVSELNLDGSVLPTLIFGEVMAKQGYGSIINISSMASARAITRVAGYSASKAAIDNFTRWMSVELALKFGDGLRVNAIAPGFFIGEQNKALLLNEDGSYTNRGNSIIRNTPMKRLGQADELHGAIHYLCSEASKFVTGIVIPVDGGFSAYSGV